MKRAVYAVVFALLLPVAVLAQDYKAPEKKMDAKKKAIVKADAKETSLHGYVIDAMCAKGMARKENVMEAAAKHTKKCALEEACAESGYGVFSDGKWYKFDEKGDVMAKELIQNTKTEKGIMVMVSGTMEADKLVLASISEHKMDKGKKMEKKQMEDGAAHEEKH